MKVLFKNAKLLLQRRTKTKNIKARYEIMCGFQLGGEILNKLKNEYELKLREYKYEKEYEINRREKEIEIMKKKIEDDKITELIDLKKSSECVDKLIYLIQTNNFNFNIFNINN